MSRAITPLRAALILTAAAAVAATAACGSSSSAASKGSGSTNAAANGGGNPYHLQEAGVLHVGTLTDAPPNVYLKDGKFTGFDNDLFSAVAAKLNLKVQFEGTDFSALLAQVKNHKFDVGSSSITI